MKKILVILFLATGLQLHAQVVNIPDKTKADFAKKYPKAENVDWDNNGTNYIARFNLGKEKYAARFHMDGTWNYTEQEMELTAFPADVQTSIKNHRYSDLKILSTAYIENSKNEKLYRVEFKKGIQKKYVFFDKTGKEIRTTSSV